MTRSRNLRLYRACQRCRQRKHKCTPSGTGETKGSACMECIRAGESCIPAASRRGGNFKQLRRSASQATRTEGEATEGSSQNHELHIDECHSEEPIFAELRNPCDALQILARLASHTHSSPDHARSLSSSRNEVTRLGIGLESFEKSFPHFRQSITRENLSGTEHLIIVVLGETTTYQLLRQYAVNYHPFYPLADKRVIDTGDIQQTAVDEPFLLTSILTIASKDEPNYIEAHNQCWQSLKRHLLDILLAAPSTLNVGTVEGLLLLAEWISYPLSGGQSLNPKTPSNNLSALEDNTAWSLIGQAVRHAYLLRLDRSAFREKASDEPEDIATRKRIAWTFIFIADRQISVRMGQSFWSRGPSLSNRLTANDFPTLQQNAGAQHHYAVVLQATIELTQILHNVHDIMYSSKRRTLNMMLSGDYSRYLDDFRRALSTWQDTWGHLEVPPKESSTLRIFHEYVRLYVHAFSFQSVVTRALFEKDRPSGGSQRAPNLFPKGIMASPDGAYIFEAVNAARNILHIAAETDPVAHVRYMPFRFYVYMVYSAVFLYKADVFGALSATEHGNIVDLLKRFIEGLECAANSEDHVGFRYSELLKRLWFANSSLLEKFPNEGPSNSTDKSTATENFNTSIPGSDVFASTDLNIFGPTFMGMDMELFNMDLNASLGGDFWGDTSYNNS